MATPLSSNLEWSLANKLWSQSLNPVIANPTNNIQILKDIPLIVGVNIINHKLGHAMNGWVVTDIQGIASIFRSAPFNDLTLTLTSSAIVVISIGVF